MKKTVKLFCTLMISIGIVLPGCGNNADNSNVEDFTEMEQKSSNIFPNVPSLDNFDSYDFFQFHMKLLIMVITKKLYLLNMFMFQTGHYGSNLIKLFLRIGHLD